MFWITLLRICVYRTVLNIRIWSPRCNTAVSTERCSSGNSANWSCTFGTYSGSIHEVSFSKVYAYKCFFVIRVCLDVKNTEEKQCQTQAKGRIGYVLREQKTKTRFLKSRHVKVELSGLWGIQLFNWNIALWNKDIYFCILAVNPAQCSGRYCSEIF